MSHSDERPVRILFVCFGNICRSPMAVGIAGKIAGDSVRAESAGLVVSGVRPTDEAVLAVKARFGADISGHIPRPVSGCKAADYDFVIALDFIVYSRLRQEGLVPEEKLFGWDIDDPLGRGYEAYLQAAAKIRARLEQFLSNQGIPL